MRSRLRNCQKSADNLQEQAAYADSNLMPSGERGGKARMPLL